MKLEPPSKNVNNIQNKHISSTLSVGRPGVGEAHKKYLRTMKMYVRWCFCCVPDDFFFTATDFFLRRFIHFQDNRQSIVVSSLRAGTQFTKLTPLFTFEIMKVSTLMHAMEERTWFGIIRFSSCPRYHKVSFHHLQSFCLPNDIDTPSSNLCEYFIFPPRDGYANASCIFSQCVY